MPVLPCLLSGVAHEGQTSEDRCHAPAAPEVLLNKKDVDKHQSDCWSIGVILYQVDALHTWCMPSAVVSSVLVQARLSYEPPTHLSLHAAAVWRTSF